MKKVVISIIVFLSGFAGLIYQVLWMRKLGLLFGNTAYAAAATLSVFFAGLALGSYYWGKRVSTKSNPLRIYACLEIGIALSAGVYFAIISLFSLIYPFFFQYLGYGIFLFLLKCILAAILVFPPAFFMGGTIPAIGEFLIERKEVFGKTTAFIYAINTLGAAFGAFAAVFLLISNFGFNITCIIAMNITTFAALISLWLSKGKNKKKTFDDSVALEKVPTNIKTSKKRKKKKKGKKQKKQLKLPEKAPGTITLIPRPLIYILAFISGFSVLALEVLWTRLFAQIHENSVYSFAIVLVIVLVCLSLGALIASLLAGMKAVSPGISLSLLLLAGSCVLAASPMLFIKLTGHLSMLQTGDTFTQYYTRLFTLSFTCIAPVCLLLGTIFPFLMKSEEKYADRPGKSIGNLCAVNTVGAILGASVCGFVLLRFIGMWYTMQLIALIYLVPAILLPLTWNKWMLFIRLAGITFIVIILTSLNSSELAVVGLDSSRGSTEVKDVWETSDCTVSVVETSTGYDRILINSNYILGSNGAMNEQILQSMIPLLLYPKTESIFFLGLGTGISAGGALNKKMFPSVKHLVACEMVPEVIKASKKYMAGGNGSGRDYTNGLYKDDRVKIVVDDGRHYLMATDEKFDMINADLFLPYRSGAGSLYSQEHFRNVKKRLTKDGVFVQWLPLFQMTESEFGVVAKTMLSVFDKVTFWRLNFYTGSEIAALIGHNSNKPIAANSDVNSEYKKQIIQGVDWRNIRDLPFFITDKTVPILYCGDISKSRDLFDKYPVNTDDKPIIEYIAPHSLREKSPDGMPVNFTGHRVANMVKRLLQNSPPDKDPLLRNRNPQDLRLPFAGLALHLLWFGHRIEDAELCRDAWQEFVKEWTDEK